jgi:HK97 gp10 family phage protein
MIEAKVTGIPDLREALAGIVPKLRVRALRNALRAGARVVQRAARAKAPALDASALPVRKGYRTPGLLRKSISVRTSKVATRAGDVGVFVNVLPAKGARFKVKTTALLGLKFRSKTQVRASQRGAKSPNAPFYWRFVNFGTRKGVKAAGFLEAGAKQLGAALEVFKAKIGPQIQKLNRPKAPAP